MHKKYLITVYLNTRISYTYLNIGDAGHIVTNTNHWCTIQVYFSISINNTLIMLNLTLKDLL